MTVTVTKSKPATAAKARAVLAEYDRPCARRAHQNGDDYQKRQEKHQRDKRKNNIDGTLDLGKCRNSTDICIYCYDFSQDCKSCT